MLILILTNKGGFQSERLAQVLWHRYVVSSLMDTAYWMSEQYSSDFFVLAPECNREPLSEDILGATTQRDTGSYYPKRYYELLPKEILGAITQRDTGSYYPKRYWDALWENG
ncbi:hypothetical protein Tco_1073003, partial [Tanacetum coccineum]